MTPITIAIFDDHPAMLAAIESEILKNTDYNIIFKASTKADLINQLKVKVPHVLLLDIIADEVLGFELFMYVLSTHPNCKIIAYTSLSSPHLVENLLSIGVQGFVNKKQQTSILIEAINCVVQGKIFVTPEYHFLTSDYTKSTSSGLTGREIEIVNHIGNELTSQQIADQLCLSVNTIESHRKRIFQKLNVKNVAGMIMEAARLGYLK